MARTKGRHEKMSGIFDIFRRKKKEIEERALALPERPEAQPQLPAVPAPPEAPRLPGFLRFFRGMIPAPPPEAETPLAFLREAVPGPPALPSPPEAPALPIPAPAVPPGPPVVWEALFGPPEEIALPSPLPTPAPAPWPAPVQAPPPAPGMPPVKPPKYTFIRIPRVVEGPWKLPTVEEFAAHLRRHFEKMDQMFDDLRELRRQPAFQKTVAVNSVEGRPVLVRVDPVVTKEVYTDLATLFNLPWNIVEAYFAGVRTEEDQRRADSAFFGDVIEPMNEELTAAFELLKPVDLPGWFTIDYDDETRTWYLFYVETAPPRLEFEGGARG